MRFGGFGFNRQFGFGPAVPDIDSPYLPQADALFLRMSVQPTAARKAAINTCIAALIDGGVWAKLYALYVTAAHDEQAAQLNWLSGNYNLLKTGTVTFTANQDYVPNGTDGYLDSQFAPNVAGQDDFAIGIYVRTSAQLSNVPIGLATGTGCSVQPRSVADVSGFRINTPTNTTLAGQTDASGLSVGNRSAAGVSDLYRGGSNVLTSAQVSGTPSSSNINIGRFNGGFTSVTCQAALLSRSLSAGEHAALNTALSTYITAVTS